MTGRTLTHYQILDPLGSGGMGEVYKARDTRLNRFVAIKVLRGDLVANVSRKQRFIQEAQSASALNHPNIVTVHDIFQHEGTDCLVMEYVQGKTLDALIPRQGLRLNEALRIAVQIAEGLRKAHAAGIVHRDIKPSNIIVPDDGPVKILDFGLAKLTETTAPSENDATLTVRPQTEEGTVMGTVAYMSPEQAEGKKVDARTDIFSFGVLLYEMLSGRRAFAGDSNLALMSAILKEEPKPLENAPPDLDKIIRRCLRKDREKRYQHMDDLKLALEEVREESESGNTAAAPVLAAKAKKWPWIAAAGATAALAAAGLWYTRPMPATATAGPLVLTRLTSDSGLATTPALSPDGKLLAYASARATNGDNLDIWVQHMGGGEPIRLTKDDADESEPTFSADGGRIAYASRAGGILVVPALGGEARQLAPRGSRPRFSPDGQWLAYEISAAGSDTKRGEIWVLPAAGGAARRIAAAFLDAASPVWSPDSQRLLFSGRRDLQTRNWWLAPLDGAAPSPVGIEPLLREARLSPVNVPSLWFGDAIIFAGLAGPAAESINLWQVRIDAATGKVSGKLQQITSGTGREMYPTAAADGTLALTSSQLRSDLWMLPADTARGKVAGDLQRLTDDPAADDTVKMPEDGSKVVFQSNRDGALGLWLRDMKTGNLRKLSPGSVRDQWPGITSDGRYASFTRIFKSPNVYYSIISLEDGTIRELEIPTTNGPWGLSRSGQYVLFSTFAANFSGLAAVQVQGGEQREVISHPKWRLLSPALSPDERWMAFHAQNSELTRQIWIAPFHFGTAAPFAEWIPITEGKALDRDPVWSPDGNMLYWVADRNGTRGIWACKLDPVTRRRVGDAFEIRMFRGARRSMMPFSNSGMTRPAVARDKIVFPLGEETGNIWTTKLPTPPKP